MKIKFEIRIISKRAVELLSVSVINMEEESTSKLFFSEFVKELKQRGNLKRIL